jgi:hypothetical protein
MPDSFLLEARKSFHAALLTSILRIDDNGVPSNADKHSVPSVQIAVGMLRRIGESAIGARLAGQMAGNKFETVCREFLEAIFPKLTHLRPGTFAVQRGGASTISACDQYDHLAELERAIVGNPELAIALGNDYFIKPDVVVIRRPEPDEKINSLGPLVSEVEARRTSLRSRNQTRAILHASISCKWTLRSDRAQNARSEALNLVRNRKGKLPHIVVVTGEPAPGRIASIALGTGDIDCVYHVALTELIDSITELQYQDSAELLHMMVEGKRVRDIADLPLDLVI